MKTNFYTSKVGTPIGFLKVLMIFFISMLSMSIVNAQTTVIIGAGSQNTTAANGAATDPGPMYRSGSTSAFIYSRHHYLYTATELAATGMTAGQLISTLEWNLGLAAASNAPFTFQIWIKNSSLTTVGAGGQLWATLIGSSTQVYNNVSTSVSGPGWQTFTLSSPFTYTGGAIEISVNFDMSSGSNPWTTAGFAWLRDPINDRTLSYVGSTPPSTTLPNLRTTRPQLRLTYISGAACSAPPTSGTSTALPATTVCPGATVTFGLSGNSTGTGQTYEWLSGPTLSGPWTSMSGVLTSPAFATTVTSSAYWRCNVTCSGQSDTSVAVFKDVASLFPGGTYTINSALPTGGGNYANFTDAVAAIQCGISGPVIFNVDAASGPYTEQITIPAITGTSSTNTITFNGNGRTLQFTPNTTNRHIIKLDGADYVAIKDLIIVGQAVDFDWGIHMINGADNDSIINCTIDLSANTSTTLANSACITATGATASITTAGNNANNLVVSGCTLIGGYHGITIYGNTGSLNAVNNKIFNNTIRDFYADGVLLNNNNGALVKNNDIHRTNRTTVGTFAGVEVGTGNINVIVDGNRIHDTHSSATVLSGTAYGVFHTACDATVGNENRVINNVIYNFNSESGLIYGLYNSSSDGVWYYHNTVVLDYAGATAGTTRGFFQTTLASNIDFKNNIIYVTRGGTGAKNCLYFGTTTSSISSNNNDLYLNSPAGTNGIGFYSVNQITLGDWQLANGGIYDGSSVSLDPLFADPGNGDFTPTNAGVNSNGANVGVATDILGNARTLAAPDPGAYEWTPLGTDAGITWVSPIPPVGLGNQTITVQITNAQTATITSLELSYTDGVSTETETFGSLSIAAGNSQQFSFTNPYNLTGNASLRAYVSLVNGAIDDNQANDTTAVQNICPVMAGNYTINSAVATGGTNFQSFTAAVNQLICSTVNGPVVFNVVPGSGPYNEQVLIPAIGGASSTNTITFNGNLETLAFASENTNQRAVITLSGADHIYVDSLVIIASGGTYGFGVHLTAGADSNKITSCIVTTTANQTSTNYAGIVMSGSLASATTAGNSGNGNEISGNTINNGYYGITVVGTSAAPFVSGNQILNNTITDHYFYGVYSLGNTGTEFVGNNIQHLNRTATSTTYGLFLTTNTIGAKVERNRIHHLLVATPASTSSVFGIYVAGDALLGSENKVVNNLIHTLGGNGIQYGIYNTGGNHMWAWHNTIALDNAGSTLGTTYGIYQTTVADSLQYYNNNISITRGGTGARYGIFFNTAGTYIKSNYNNIYVNTPGSDSIGSYAGTAFTTLVNWQTANASAYDQQSVNADPQFLDPNTGNYQPSVVALDNVATPLGVTNDINGAVRSLVTPDIGSYEYYLAPEDIGVFSLVTPAGSAGICYTPAETVTLRIKNYGLNAIDFALNPATITCNVTGATTATLNGTPSGILPINGTMDVVMSSTLDMSVIGSYTFNASVVMTGDGNAANDAMSQVSITTLPSVVGTTSSSVAEICVSGTPTFTLTGSVGNIQWQTSTVDTTGPWSNVGTNSPVYIPSSPLTQTTYYRVLVSCNASIDSSSVDSVVVNTPLITSSTGDSNCGPGVLNLSATGNGSFINWYTAPTGGSPVGSGTNFVTPLISTTTTYYAEASIGDLPAVGGRLTNTAGSVLSAAPRGIIFTATEAVTLDSVGILCSGVASAVTVQLYNSGGTATIGAPVVINIPANAGSSSVPVLLTFPVNIQVPAAGTYRLFVTSVSPTGNVLWYEFSGVTGYPYAVGPKVSITSSVTSLTGAASLTTYYYFYKLVIGSGCAGPRTPVVATITAPPAITVSSQYPGVCAGGSSTISVTSANDPNYEFTWSSNPSGFSATGNGPHTVSPTVTTTYIVNALDTSSGANSGCVNVDSVTIVYAPTLTPGTVSASSASYCFSGAPTITSSSASGFIQWQESTVSGNGPWTNVGTGANTYVPGTITQTTYYRLLVSCETNLDSSNVDTVIVFLPQVLSANGDTRCGPGTLNLSATTDPGYNLNWFADSTGGSPLGAGSPFTTPLILQTDTFYVESNSGTGSSDSLQVPLASGGTTGVYHHMFTVSAPTGMQINKIGIKCNNTVGTLTAWDIYYRPDDFKLVAGANTSSAGWILVSTVTGVPSLGPTTYTTIASGISIDIPAGATYSIYVAPATGATHQYGTSAAGTVVGTNAVGSVIAGYRGSALFNCTTTSGFAVVSLGYSVGCPSARVPVIATVTPSPAIAVSGSTTICAGDSSNVTISAGLGDYTTFTWFPTTGLSSATGSSIYAKPTVTSKYYVLASGNVGNCQALDSITITVNDFNLSVAMNNPMLCGASDSTQITTTATGGTFTYLWTPAAGLSSDTIPNPKARPVGSSETYTVTVTNTATGCVKTRSVTVYVSAPAILSTVADTVCGTDQVSLTATATPGTQISWWNTATGGTRLGVGSSFVSTISSTTKFYVESRDTIAQTPVSTGFNGGIIATDPNAAGNMFNVTAINNLRVTGFDVHLDTVSSLQPSNIAVYYKVGSYAGSTLNASAWTLAGTANGVVSAGRGVATPVPLSLDIPINAGQTYGFYIVVTNLGVANSLVYNSSGTSPAEFAVASSDNNLQVRSGTVIFGPFTGQVASPFNRLWNGNVKYDIGCVSARDSVEAVSLTAPSISLATLPNDTICAGSSVTLQASSANDPNYSYEWNPGALSGGSVVVTPSSQTKYYVTATDTSSGGTAGCIVVDSLTINLFSLPVVNPTATPSTICAGATSQLAANALGASPQSDSLATGLVDGNGSSLVGFDIVNTSALPVTINNFSFRSNLAAGTNIPVTLMYSANPLNCVIPSTFTPLPPGWVSLGVSNATSAGGPSALTFVPLNINITIPPGATYAFALGSTTSGSVRYANGVAGCPNVISDSKITIKSGFGGALTGTTIAARDFAGRVSYTVPAVGNLSYLWSPSTGLSSTTVANPIATAFATTNYTVVVTNNDNGCSSSGNVSLNVNDGPKPVIVENDTTLCNPDEIYIHVVDTGAFSGGYPSGTQFTWSALGVPIVDLDSISSINGSSYSVIVTLPSGCTASSDTITVLTKSVAVVESISNASCVGGGSIAVTVTSGIADFNYVWSTDLAQTNIVRNVTKTSNQDTLDNIAAGTYYLQVYDEAGTPASCNSGVLTYVVGGAAQIVASVTPTDITCNGNANGAADVTWTGGSSPYFITWSDGNFANTTPRGISAGGNYSVIVSDNSGCADTVAFVIVEPLPVSVTFTSTPESFPGALDGTATAIPAGGTGPYTFIWADETFSPAGSGNPLTGVAAGLYYGLVTDANGCDNSATVLGDSIRIDVISNATFNLTMLIEGFYDGLGGLTPALLNSGVGLSATECDTIYVELRDQLSPTTVLASGTAVLNTSGQASFTFPGAVIGQNGYIAVFHRNAVQTWSDVITFAGLTNYNFTTAATQAFGGNQVQLAPGVFAMYSGDLSPQDEFIDLLDQGVIDNDIFNFAGGYVVSDLNGDGFVDLVDQSIVDNNIFNFIGSVHP